MENSYKNDIPYTFFNSSCVTFQLIKMKSLLVTCLILVTISRVQGLKYSRNQKRPSGGDHMMDGDMDTMPPDSHLLTQAPPDFAMLPTTNRIVNGQSTDIKNFPYQLQLGVYSQLICGASLISKQWAVTAAHCMFDNDDDKIPLNAITLRAGTSSYNKAGSVQMVNKRIIHSMYNPRRHDHDIALLKASKPFVYSKTIRPIALPKPGQDFADGSVGVLTGWGHTERGGRASQQLQFVLVPLVNQDVCVKSYRPNNIQVTPRMLCAGVPGKDSCQGDSGGPLAVKDRLVGVVSFAIGCAKPGYPGVNTKVSTYRNFIKKYTGV